MILILGFLVGWVPVLGRHTRRISTMTPDSLRSVTQTPNVHPPPPPNLELKGGLQLLTL